MIKRLVKTKPSISNLISFSHKVSDFESQLFYIVLTISRFRIYLILSLLMIMILHFFFITLSAPPQSRSVALNRYHKCKEIGRKILLNTNGVFNNSHCILYAYKPFYFIEQLFLHILTECTGNRWSTENRVHKANLNCCSNALVPRTNMT